MLGSRKPTPTTGSKSTTSPEKQSVRNWLNCCLEITKLGTALDAAPGQRAIPFAHDQANDAPETNTVLAMKSHGFQFQMV